MITQLFPHGAVELETKEGVRFKVNGQRIKLYFGHAESANEVIEAYHLDEGELQSVSAISYKEKMKKHHDLKIEK